MLGGMSGGQSSGEERQVRSERRWMLEAALTAWAPGVDFRVLLWQQRQVEIVCTPSNNLRVSYHSGNPVSSYFSPLGFKIDPPLRFLRVVVQTVPAPPRRLCETETDAGCCRCLLVKTETSTHLQDLTSRGPSFRRSFSAPETSPASAPRLHLLLLLLLLDI